MKSLSIHEYMQHIPYARPGSGDTFWIRAEMRSLVRMPTYCLTPPAPGEIDRLLWRSAMLVASYIVPPTPDQPANAWLYLCRAYDISKIHDTGRRNAKRARRMLRIEFAPWETILAHGARAYCDTRARNGLSDGTAEAFQRRYGGFSQRPCHQAVAAWKDNQLVAFDTLKIMNNAVEIEGTFSINEHRDTRPNDGLCNFVLDYFLNQCGYDLVSYGLSSIQPGSHEEGLHHFKCKVGFEAVPVHRTFEIHPLLRPAVNPLALRVLNLLLSRNQANRRLRKAVGLMSLVLEGRDHPPAARHSV
jgi:hypothetical protein